MEDEKIIIVILAVYAVVMTAIFLIVLHCRKKKQEKRFYDFQNKALNTQMEEMNQIYRNVRGWRHDYHNHMQTIKAHLALGQIAEAESYVDKMEGELDRIDFKYKTGNIGVDAILNSKLTLAEKHGIAVKCDAVLPKELSVSQLDLSVILGNLIDNAVEACDKIPDKKVQEDKRQSTDISESTGASQEMANTGRDALNSESGTRPELDTSEEERPGRFLRIYMCVRKKQLYLSVTNATSEIIRKLDQEYISKKRGNHGHGLKRIDMTVEKCGGYINRQNEPGVFATEIMLPLVI